jgi:hypothetical protein
MAWPKAGAQAIAKSASAISDLAKDEFDEREIPRSGWAFL